MAEASEDRCVADLNFCTWSAPPLHSAGIDDIVQLLLTEDLEEGGWLSLGRSRLPLGLGHLRRGLASIVTANLCRQPCLEAPQNREPEILGAGRKIAEHAQLEVCRLAETGLDCWRVRGPGEVQEPEELPNDALEVDPVESAVANLAEDVLWEALECGPGHRPDGAQEGGLARLALGGDYPRQGRENSGRCLPFLAVGGLPSELALLLSYQLDHSG